jgi:hypothetical protein
MNLRTKTLSALVLLMGIVCTNAVAQWKYAASIIVGGPEFDSRSATSAKLGVTNIYTDPGCQKYCFELLYNQIQAKYNFSEKAVGLQSAVGYSLLFIGGRAGVDYEYNIESKDSDFMLFLTGGFDVGGVASLQIGPKINLTQNNSTKAVLLMVTVDLPISTLFQKGKIKEAAQGLRTFRSARKAKRQK